MQSKIDTASDPVTLELSGQLIYSDTANFSEILKEFQSIHFESCDLLLPELEHIDSSGLRMLFLLYELCQEKSAKLIIRGATGRVRELLLHCRFNSLVQIVA